jgi:hypothetical protein
MSGRSARILLGLIASNARGAPVGTRRSTGPATARSDAGLAAGAYLLAYLVSSHAVA